MRTVWIQACVVLAAAAGIALAVAGCGFSARALDVVDGGSPNSYACSCTCEGGQSTPTLVIAASTDDCEEDVGSSAMNLTGANLRMVQANTQKFVGLRFANVPVPPGAMVQSAFIQFTASGTDSTATDLELLAQDADDAPTFGTDDGNLSVRPETSLANDVEWSPGAWVSGESGPAEQTPDLSPFLNEVFARSGWMAGNAVVVIIRGSGRRVASSFDANPANAPKLILTYAVPGSTSVTLQTCMGSDLNPGLNGGTTPTPDQLQTDCSGRVAQTLGHLDSACGYPSACACNLVADATPKFAEACTTDCAAVPLAPDCSNFDPNNGSTSATNVDGDAPVCVAHSPITSELFGQKSLCDVSGQISFHSDDDSKTSDTRGLVEFNGRPCPGQSCEVGMSYVLDADPMTFSSFFGSATFRNLASVGESQAGQGALLATDGTGAFGPDSTASSARGTRGSTQMAVNGSNGDPVQVALRWGADAPACSISGTLVGSVDPELKRCENAGPSANQVCTEDSDCTDDDGCSDGVCNCIQVGATDTTIGLSLDGTLLNQPPSVQAGADQTVECNQAGGAHFDLHATGSDADGNASLYTWFRGARPGTAVGYVPNLQLEQPVSTTEPYFVRLIDAFAQADEATTHVQVVDTTPPVISCNAPASINPTEKPVSFQATASDICDPSVVPQLTDFECFRVNGSGKVVDKTHACAVTLEGDTIHIAHGNGVGEHIRWTAQVTDGSGNSSSASCETVIARK